MLDLWKWLSVVFIGKMKIRVCALYTLRNTLQPIDWWRERVYCHATPHHPMMTVRIETWILRDFHRFVYNAHTEHRQSLLFQYEFLIWTREQFCLHQSQLDRQKVRRFIWDETLTSSQKKEKRWKTEKWKQIACQKKHEKNKQISSNEDEIMK